MGKLEAEAGGDEAGEAHWAKAHAIQPSYAPAAEALERLARTRGNWVKVAQLLADREKAAAPGDRRALCLELASVYQTKLNQPQAAVPYLEKAVAAAPDDAAVIEPLAELYYAAGRLDDALPLYKKLAQLSSKSKRGKDLARLHCRIGAIAEKRNDVGLALEQYGAAYQIDPSHSQTLAALGRLYMGQSEWEKARKIYRGMLLQNLDPASGVTKADVYLHLGEIHEKLGEGPKALGMYERGLESDANHAALKTAVARVKR
jgi:tetratricopeptide (TPR) repeat protein